MLTPYKAKALFRRGPEAIARIFLALRFSPNGITLFGLSLGLLSSLWFIKYQNPVWFGILIISCGLFDLVDGAAARLTNRITKFGSYLDAMCDRVFDIAATFSAAYVSGHWALLFLGISGATLISYAKARAAMEVPIENTKWPDLMERFERSLIFVIGLILWGFVPQDFFGHDLFFWVLVGLNLAVYVTVIQRILRAKRFINSAS
jgi:phosphatidylglycerophosphate synthase